MVAGIGRWFTSTSLLAIGCRSCRLISGKQLPFSRLGSVDIVCR